MQQSETNQVLNFSSRVKLSLAIGTNLHTDSTDRVDCRTRETKHMAPIYNKMGRVVHCRSRRAILIKAYYSVASPFPQAKVPRLLAGRRRGAYLVSLTDFSADSHFFITFARLVRCLIYPGFSR